jgi:hypothetical protein
MLERGADYGRSFMRDALALWDEKAFGNYIAIRCIDYEHKPAGDGTAM